jgi:Ca-activated chloride channel family protein
MALATCAAIPVSANGPDDARGRVPVQAFKIGIEMVALNVTVTDPRQQFVGGLTRDDFEIYEDGLPQQLVMFSAGDVPVDVVVLLDVSSSLRGHVGIVHAAANRFVGTLRPQDRAVIVGFNQSVRALSDWTNDKTQLEHAVDSVDADGETALYSALYIALKSAPPDMPDGVARRRAIVLLSDGDDTKSLMSFDDVLRQSQQSGVSIYTIRVDTDVDTMADEWRRIRRGGVDPKYVMNTLARATGARAFELNSLNGLGAAYSKIAEELSHQYLLAYVPNTDPAANDFHTIAVRLPGRTDAVARTRPGYLRPASGKRAGREH